MTKKTINLEGIRRANARLDAYLAEHPDALDALSEKTEAEWREIVRGVIVGKQVFSVREAAEMLNLNEQTIRRAIKKQALKAAKIGKDYRISRADLESYYRDLGGGELFSEGE